MAGLGGIGAFASGFQKSFTEGLRQRKLREQLDVENALKIQREKRMSEQFEMQQQFREKQFESLEGHRERQLGMQERQLESLESHRGETLDMRREEQGALQEYRKSQQEIQQRQMEIQQKGLDLQTMGAWDKILDPSKPKSMRKFMFKQLTGALGIDPKSAQAKDFEGMLSGMEDENLEEVRQGLLAMLPDATPGQITAMSKAIISGQIQMKDAIEQFAGAAKSQRAAKKLSLGSGGGQEKKPTGSLTSPTPMSQQTGKLPGGTLPVPGMESQTGPEESHHRFTAQQLRDKAVELAQDPDIDTAQVSLFAQLARDTEAAGKETLELKQIVTTDAEGNRIEKWVSEEEAIGKQAPSGRPVPTREESAASREAEALADLDVTKLKPVYEKAETAREFLPQIETYRELLRSGKFETGSFANIRESVGRIARLTGAPQEVITLLDDLKFGDPAIAEAMNAVSNQMGLTFAGDVSRLTNMSLSLITGAIPSLLKTPEGNEIILEVYESKGKQAIEIEELAENYIDQHGTLRPKGKPSFFEERAKIMRRSLLKPDFEERFMEAKKKGEGIDIEKIITGSKKEQIILKDEEGEDMTFEKVGKHEKGLPLVKLRDGQDYPYAATPKDAEKLESGTLYLRQHPIKGPILDTRK